MRSLALLEIKVRQLVEDDATVTGIAIDASSDTVFAISERPRGSKVDLSVYSLEKDSNDQYPIPFASFSVEVPPKIGAVCPTAVVSFKYLPESDSLCIILSNGDIEQIFSIADGSDDKTTSNVGTIEAGVKSAAWSPDDELLVIITGDDELIEMTKDFEVLSEGPLRSASFGEDAPVNVGWGEKSTQFHGSVGKTAATSESKVATTSIQLSPDDDGSPRISWRGDGAFFCVSSLDPLPTSPVDYRRILRVFSRVASLSSTSEPTPGVEHSLSWQPSGSIIAATQKIINSNRTEEAPSQHVIFFERNGLRRYDFALREDTSIDALDGVRRSSKVKSLEWNSDSTVLAIWIERKAAGVMSDVVQLWHRNNYYWYLKQELSPRISATRITSIFWHVEKALDLFLVTRTGIESFSLCWDTFSSSQAQPYDSGAVAVIDGSSTKLTPFRNANIPPPMSSTIALSSRTFRTPVHISFCATSNHFVALYTDGFVEVWNWTLPTPSATGRSRSEVSDPTIIWTSQIPSSEESYARQCACVMEDEQMVVAVVQSTLDGSRLVVLDCQSQRSSLQIPEGVTRMVAGSTRFILEANDGSLLEVSSTNADAAVPSDLYGEFPEVCSWIQHIPLPDSSSTVVGLTESGRLYSGLHLVSPDVTSFIFTPDFLIYTTFSHEAKFVTLTSILRIASHPIETYHTEAMKKESGSTADSSRGELIKRTVERGSRIVVVVPSSTTLVLQMPRGNIETIYPRPLVLQIVRQDLDLLRFRAAFLSCRRHRIDLNILYDHNPTSFKQHLNEFVSQIKDVDYLNLFLSGLKEDDVTKTMYKPLNASPPSPLMIDAPSKINSICDLVRQDLQKRDIFHYANTILTAHVRKSPPDYESALNVLVSLKAQDATRAEDAVKYIIFLSDANKLFDLALGMYDFPLVLMIAQHSQKDPREYVPFLRDLRSLEKHMQRFKIDDHLERFESALRNIAQAGSEHFEDTVEYTKLHGLFTVALAAFKGDAVKYKIILTANAEYLLSRHDYAESGLLFALAGETAKALHSYQKANSWQELFTLALSEGKRTASEIKLLAVEVSDRLKEKRRFFEAGRVLLEYGRDVEAAVAAFVEAGSFAEAIRLTALYSKRELVETLIKPGVLEVHSRLIDDFGEVVDQIEKQKERLEELKAKRDANPDMYYCLLDPASAIDNLEMQPDGASDAGTAFTRYTIAPTTIATTRITSRTNRSKQRKNIKKLAGKKGSVYEETYLLNSIKKLAEVRMLELQIETAALLPILLSLATPSLRTAAASLQESLSSLESTLSAAMISHWSWREAEWKIEKREEREARERGDWIEKGPVEEGMEKVLMPVLAKQKWRLGLLDSLV